MTLINKVIAGLIALCGVTIYRLPHEKDIFYTAQFCFFIAASFGMASYLIYKKNKWLAAFSVLAILSFIKTLLLEQASKFYLFESLIIGTVIFTIYFVSYELKIKKDVLKFFLIPAIANIIIVFIQFFDKTILPFLPYSGSQPIGLIGNSGFVGGFLGLTTPIFIEFLPKGIPFLLLAILLSKGSTGLVIFIFSIALYVKYKKIHLKWLIAALLFILPIIFIYRYSIISEILLRLSMFYGSLDAIIQRHLILGWGVGNFQSIMARVSVLDSTFLGIPFNTPDHILNHPHNELIFFWWSFGILSIPIFIGLVRDIFKRFTKERLLPFAILIGGFIYSMNYFLVLPAWFLVMMAFGIYDSKNKGGLNGKDKEEKRKVL